MAATTTAEPFLPDTDALPALAGAAANCRGCELYRNATQTVFGRGPADAALMLVGEQPGVSRTSAANRSSGPPASCSTGPWRRPASTPAGPTRQTP
ncbi:MAG TPA: hypothetical protein VFU36_06820 [Jatrophihabitans sp.]|nr:hypothetical protein [Jatrophihabitans sp.]